MKKRIRQMGQKPILIKINNSITLSAGLLSAPADGDPYCIVRTDIRAVAAVDAFCCPLRQALAVRHLKTFYRAGVDTFPAPRALLHINNSYKHLLSPPKSACSISGAHQILICLNCNCRSSGSSFKAL